MRIAKRFKKRAGLAHLLPLTALGRSHSPVGGVLRFSERAPTVLLVESSFASSKLIANALVGRGYAVVSAKSASEGLALFQEQPQIGLAVMGLTAPGADILDLAAELERLRPGFPVLYLVGDGESIARRSIEAQAPGSVLAVPFAEKHLMARVGALFEAAAGPGPDEQLWQRLIAVSDWIPLPIAMLRVYQTRQAALAESHAALLSAGNIEHAVRTTNCKVAPYGVTVCARDVAQARRLIGRSSADRQIVFVA